ncbi:RNA polymerase II C-terminal domain phosphatase-like 3 [Typha latifolia]|uniref:RNA polymerase II C-terminal domain phosphatase-like 3 n=1 Tax=Typha latifolia TaxID=4733 RepID=UPI003C2D314D
MRVAVPSRHFLNPSDKETLARIMAKNRSRAAAAAEADEGEVSDGESSASLEEISAEDFKSPRSSVWMGYPMSRGYATNLYSFAWAQAVQNKPLGLDLKPMSSSDPQTEDCDEVIEDNTEEESTGGMEKEEGELEEGEIGLGSEQAVAGETVDLEPDVPEKETEERESDATESEEIGDFDRHVGLILEELESITMEEAETSFEDACARLRKTFESLKPMFLDTGSPIPVLDALVQQAFLGIETVNSVLSSGKLQKREQNKELFLRLLIHIKNQYYRLLSPEQITELDKIVKLLVFEDGNNVKELPTGSGGITDRLSNMAESPGISSCVLVSSEKPLSEQSRVNSLHCNYPNACFPNLELANALRNKGVSPLLDLHADYDESSLPSPTRENPPPLPVPKPVGFGSGAAVSTQPVARKNMDHEPTVMQPYVTDAVKAVSSYQQKYGRSYTFPSNQLPSPTPSEESHNDDDPDMEVSSSLVADNVTHVNTMSSMHVVRSSCTSAYVDNLRGHQQAPVNMVTQLVPGPNPGVKLASKSRDPRLRFVNSEIGGAFVPNQHRISRDSNISKDGIAEITMNSRKHKPVNELLPDDHALKKQKNAVNARDVQMTSGRGGWLEDGSAASHPGNGVRLNGHSKVEVGRIGNGDKGSHIRLNSNLNYSSPNGEIVQDAASTSAPAISSLPSLLKNIAVNPTMLMQLIQMEQKRVAIESQQKSTASAVDMTNMTGVNVTPGTVLSANGLPAESAKVVQNPAARIQITAQRASMNDTGRIRMKPRDPRRILHTNIAQKNDIQCSEQTKENGTPLLDPQSNRDNLTVREQGEQAQPSGLPPQSITITDMAQQFSKNMKNVVDKVSSSQMISTFQVVPQNISQPAPSIMNKVDAGPGAVELHEPKNASGVAPEGVTTSTSQSVNPWGDVDHLLDGYDDQQKAAIQRERAKRITEQNKMFAARKLSLVLDLDHTLLNSAKFAEIDLIHEEILRKKEEQDREKPQRHLFRFQHMGMWTKLRPGIWNFLEKASKLYELHLYTMGNKLYATEMAKVLDPTGTLFAGRVTSKGDDCEPFDGDERVPKSKDLDGVLGMESAVVIIDDSVRVWPHNKLNLIVVERYTYFPCSRRQFGLHGPSLLEIDHDERPEDGTLASSLAVIERIHQNFFSHRSLNDVDVRNILAAEQRKILGGCRIVFSRIFPVGESNPHLHPLWQAAEQFGAVCTTQIDEQVTHVVANSLGTDKVNWALSTGRFVVHPGWVEASTLLYRRANEQDFAVKL